jgi:serine/threonine protein kinase
VIRCSSGCVTHLSSWCHAGQHPLTHHHDGLLLLLLLVLRLQVFQVRARSSGKVFAMKVMRKERILQKDHGDYVRAERDLLTAVVHPYIVTMRYSFQSASKLYLVLDFINGGHLFFNLYRQVGWTVQLRVCIATAEHGLVFTKQQAVWCWTSSVQASCLFKYLLQFNHLSPCCVWCCNYI